MVEFNRIFILKSFTVFYNYNEPNFVLRNISISYIFVISNECFV